MGPVSKRSAALADLARAGVRDMRVEIVEYDPSWPAAFEEESRRLAALLSGTDIHHIGSTAVPGLVAKPIIDMVALVDSYEAPVARLVAEGGYQYPQAFNATLVKRCFLAYPTPSKRTPHLQLVDDPSELARYLRFRDYLRTDPALARQYATLKRTLAERHGGDREAYTEAKTEFVRRYELPTTTPSSPGP
jgi:GrpB-like predicted nucleotidyltransferase (UPF0157 family)